MNLQNLPTQFPESLSFSFFNPPPPHSIFNINEPTNQTIAISDEQNNHCFFFFNALPNALKIYMSIFLTFDDLAHLALIQKEYSNILKKTDNANVSPYLTQKLRYAKSLTSQEIHKYRCAAKVDDISNILKYCESLRKLDLRYEFRIPNESNYIDEFEKKILNSQNEIVFTKEMAKNAIRMNPHLKSVSLKNYSTQDILSIIPTLENCKNLKSLSINTGIDNYEDIISKHCPNIRKLRIDCAVNPRRLQLLIEGLKNLRILQLRMNSHVLLEPFIVGFLKELTVRNIEFHWINVKRTLNF